MTKNGCLDRIIEQYYVENNNGNLVYNNKLARRWMFKCAETELSVIRFLGLGFEQFCEQLDIACAEKMFVDDERFEKITLQSIKHDKSIDIQASQLKPVKSIDDQLFDPGDSINRDMYEMISGPRNHCLNEREDEWFCQALFNFDCACLYHFIDQQQTSMCFDVEVLHGIRLMFNIERDQVIRLSREIKIDQDGIIERDEIEMPLVDK